MTAVLVISPIPTLRAGLRALLMADSDFQVSALSSLESWTEDLAAPGVVVATADALDEDDLDRLAGWGVLLVGDEPEAARAISAGRAWGLLNPDASPDALQAAVRALSEGLVVVSPGLTDALLALPRAGSALSFSAAAREPLNGEEPPEDLTPREAEVLGMAAQGLTNKQIAFGLGISEHTVKFHMSAVFEKLNVSNRAEAVRKGARWGWVAI